MTIDYKIRDEKLQNSINGEAAKISALLSRKIDKNEYVTGEKILHLYQRPVIEQAKFTLFSFKKHFRKTKKGAQRL